MKNKERLFALILSLILIAAGIVFLIIPIEFINLLAFLLGIILIVSGGGKLIQFLFNRHNGIEVTLGALLGGILTTTLGILLVCNPFIANVFLEKVLAVWLLLMGLIKLIIAYTYKKAAEKQWISTLIAALLSIIFGIIVWSDFSAWELVLSLWVPVYFIVLGGSNLLDLLFDRLSDRARIPLPLWMEAFFPQKVLKGVKEELTANPSSSYTPDSIYIDGMEMRTDDIEVFVHLSERSASSFGHVDIGFGDYVLSYGNYDHSKEAVSFFGLLYDGIFFICPREAYIKFSIEEAGKTIMGYKLNLNEQAKQQVIRNVNAFLKDCSPWSPAEKDRSTNDYSWALKEIGAHLFQVTKGKFKTYFVLNTNCALLSEVLLSGTGVPKSRAVGGSVTPGSVYALYEKELGKQNSLVVSQRTYLNNDMLTELKKQKKAH